MSENVCIVCTWSRPHIGASQSTRFCSRWELILFVIARSNSIWFIRSFHIYTYISQWSLKSIFIHSFTILDWSVAPYVLTTVVFRSFLIHFNLPLVLTYTIQTHTNTHIFIMLTLLVAVCPCIRFVSIINSFIIERFEPHSITWKCHHVLAASYIQWRICMRNAQGARDLSCIFL